ncbi:MAG: hypothetical protein KBG28_29220 [Kofleriaceae bacterium]|jgi:hypothetical protein|nr:hypothetical protein [Kofleriaceae bacterium]MBP6837906.1 hypothetical protein [Kofleriaceae bacterium]MBP9208084.1 hypothetical protein [Kofleriaceae bacterium]
MSDTHKGLEERGRALEDEFFHKENQKKLAAMQEQLSKQETAAELKKASGMDDDTVIAALVDLGMRANTIAALSLVPLIAVAWADGSIQDNERDAILKGAHGKGIERGSAGYELLDGWLRKKPADSLFAAWEDYIKALASKLSAEQKAQLRGQIVGFAKVIAEAAGGFLGIGKVSGTEHKVLGRIEAAFA